MSRRPAKEAPDSIDIHVGQQLKNRRLGLKMSQKDIGDFLGYTFQQIQKYENGKNRIGASNLFKLAHCLDVPVAYFFDGLKFDQKSKSVSSLPFSVFQDEIAIKLVREFLEIPTKDMKLRVLNLVRDMSKMDLNVKPSSQKLKK